MDIYLPEQDLLHRNRHEKNISPVMNGHVDLHPARIDIPLRPTTPPPQENVAPKSILRSVIDFLLGSEKSFIEDDENENDEDDFDFGTDDEADADFLASATGQYKDKVCVKLEENVFLGVNPKFDWSIFEDDLNADDKLSLQELEEEKEEKKVIMSPLRFKTQNDISIDIEISEKPKMVNVKPSGFVYVLRESRLSHFVEMAKDKRGAEPKISDVEAKELIYDTNRIVNRKGEYIAVHENYYWSYKLFEQYTEQAIDALEVASKRLNDPKLQVTKQDIENSISYLRMIVPKIEEKTLQ